MASKYQKRHYIDIAKLLNNYVMMAHVENRRIHDEQLDAMVYDFCALFGRDNSNFNRETFEKAVYGVKYVDTLVDEDRKSVV